MCKDFQGAYIEYALHIALPGLSDTSYQTIQSGLHARCSLVWFIFTVIFEVFMLVCSVIACIKAASHDEEPREDDDIKSMLGSMPSSVPLLQPDHE